MEVEEEMVDSYKSNGLAEKAVEEAAAGEHLIQETSVEYGLTLNKVKRAISLLDCTGIYCNWFGFGLGLSNEQPRVLLKPNWPIVLMAGSQQHHHQSEPPIGTGTAKQLYMWSVIDDHLTWRICAVAESKYAPRFQSMDQRNHNHSFLELIHWKSRVKSVVRVPTVDIGNPFAIGIPSDGYFWRQYALEPIKDSLYPRVYYKCTMGQRGGCSARKHVVKAADDPSMLIITYEGEHTNPFQSS